MPKPEISAVQQGDRRIEYHRAGRTIGNIARYWSGVILGVVWTIVVASMAHSVGVDQGTDIGLTACASGDSVSVDPAVTGDVD